MGRNGHANHRSSERKLKQILRGAARVFCEKGFEGASVRDISRATGVSLSGLYYYFESKQKLLYLIQYHTFTSVVSRLEKRLDGVDEPTERLRALIRNHLDYFMSHPVEMKVLSHEDEALEAPYRKEVAAVKRRYYEIARGIFEDLRRQGVARPVNPRVAVLTLFGMMNWVYTWHKFKLDPGAESLAETITEIFLSGIAGDSQSDRAPELAKRHRVAAGLPSQAAEVAR